MILNYILIRIKFTKTMDVDVWNYWDEDVPFPVAVSGLEVATLAMAKKSSHEAMT